MNVAEEKKLLRARLRERARTLPPDYFREAGERIAARILSLDLFACSQTIFCFVGAQSEIDTRPILLSALNGGKRLCVPLCVGKGEMEAREILELSQLSPGAYGIMEPPPASPRVPFSSIDLAIIPCLSCDRSGARLGRGGGYYDRFLSAYRGASILLCPAKMMEERIPTEPHDRRVNMVLSEIMGEKI